MTIPKARFHEPQRPHRDRATNDAFKRLEGAISGRLGPRSDAYVVPQEFGAAGNGATDDTEAFRAALTALSDAGGGLLRVPHGTYRVASEFSSSTPAFTIPNNVEVLMARSAVVADYGDYVTVRINAENDRKAHNITLGVIRNGDGDGVTGSATVGVEIKHSRNVQLFAEILGDFSEAGFKLTAANGENVTWSTVRGYIPANGGNVPPYGVLTETAGTGFVNANVIDVISYRCATAHVGLINGSASGAVDTNIVRGAQNAGGKGIVVGDGTNDATNNILDFPRIENNTDFGVHFTASARLNRYLSRKGDASQTATGYKDEGEGNDILTPNSDTGRSQSAYKTISGGPISLTAGSSKRLAVFAVAPNRAVRVYSGGCVRESDLATDANFLVELYNETDGAIEHGISDAATSRGRPLKNAVYSQTKQYSVRLRNASGGAHTLIGWMTVSVDGE